ncbi:MAG TPA: lysophospholipid acyltransferase family protein [Lachnospiraceae bacterium]|nr:lysophospholipid acyltransferase family protein [Lachnospiraceae bacterium]
MVRFYYIIFIAMPLIIYNVTKASYYIKHPEKYDEDKCYLLAQRFIDVVKQKGRIDTHVYGEDHLPDSGGYVMYSNHQGRYDALGIIGAHKKPCTVVMDYDRSLMPISNEFIGLLHGKRLKKDDLRQQVKTIQEMITELQQGRKYLIFPEGGYTDNHNTLQEFHAGSFKCAQKAGCPIVPVVIWDSYKPFEGKSIERVSTQVHFLEVISPDTFTGKSTAEIRDMVRNKIEERINEIAEKEGPYNSAEDKMEFAE